MIVLICPWFRIAFICFSLWFSIVFIYFSKGFPRREEVNLACFIIYFWLQGNISSPVRYSYLLILPDDKVKIFAASMLISYYRFSSLIWSSIYMIILHTYFKRCFLNLNGLSDVKVVSLPKKDTFLGYMFYRSS